MSQNTEFYTLPDEDILESLRKDVAGIANPVGFAAPRGVAGARRAERSARGQAASGTPGNSRPLVAATLSLFICGAGQIFNRQFKLGLMMFLLAAFAVATHWGMATAWTDLVKVGEFFGFGEADLMMVSAVMGLLLITVILTSVSHAYRSAEAEGGEFNGYNEPVISGMASLLVPGFGQIINAQIGKAGIFLFFLLTAGVTASLIRFSPLLRILGVSMPGDLLATGIGPAAAVALGVAGVAWILSVYDAILVASLRRRLG